ncbi:MAG: sulfite exporter TauE/SafE family protein [Terriglobales bacterium]
MTGIELWVVFTLGLVSSLHCVQMCGPIVLSYSVALDRPKLIQPKPVQPTHDQPNPDLSTPAQQQTNPTSRALLFGHLAYNAGRILTYAALGAVAGLAGKTVSLIGRLAGFASIVAIVGGVLMLLAGLIMFGAFPGVHTFGSNFFRVTSSYIRPLASLISSPSVGKRFLLGLALGLLPCGLIYAALLRALATGSPLWGAATMAAFGAGTAGALLAVGIFSSALRGTFQRWGTQFAALGVIAMGALLIVRGTMPAFLAGAHAHVCH